MKDLSRKELKEIKGGVMDDSGGDSGHCKQSPCSVYDSATGVTHHGNCGYTVAGRWGVAGCECITDLGFYIPSSGASSCWVS